MRIVAGEFRGRPLLAPEGEGIRPTSDRVRQTIFDVLAHSYGDPVPGARVLDLFAGTGAFGIEAISRGAASALFVDDGAEARGLIRGNVETFGLTGRTRIFRRDATRLGEVGTVQPFTLVFADPPYGRGLGEQALASAAAGGWLEPAATIVLEETAEAKIAAIPGLDLLESRAIGDTAVHFLAVGAPRP
ncbi:MAG TPA: 16S rRNA (guanine(966)-N(2))-methyltransferase RsmD [Bauldia sp.]|nr:16S rRNA (guanine(966)-N(2))-methyltransferase RsmD [Bauldia sp.]